jgi:hypothetical protein
MRGEIGLYFERSPYAGRDRRSPCAGRDRRSPYARRYEEREMQAEMRGDPYTGMHDSEGTGTLIQEGIMRGEMEKIHTAPIDAGR